MSKRAHEILEDLENEALLSVAGLWEIAIKATLGKLVLAKPFADLIPEQVALNEIALLGIEMDHLAALVALPLHHRDPFDRLIVAQAISEKVPVLSRDPAFADYDVQVIW